MTTTTTQSRRVLELENLSIAFGRGAHTFHAVKSLSLHVDRGETLAIVGESGSGKSVTSLAVMRLVEFGGGRIESGRMTFYRGAGEAVDLAAASEDSMRAMRGNDLGMIFQEPMTSLNPVFTVGAQIVEAIRLHQACDARAAQAAAKRILDQVRIPDSASILGRYPHELSGGMRQRVMIAMALSCKPALLIADEPTTALDVTIQAQILQLIRELQREMDMGVIFITHDMGVVAEVADRVLVMRKGDVVENNDVHGLFNAPSHPYTKALMAAVPRLGAMQGTTAPARFALLSDAQARHEAEPPAVAPSDKVVLRVRDLVTRFDVRGGIFARVKKRVHAVEQVSFDLHAGETLSLVGESGCGKTSTGRSLLRLAKTTRGQIEFDGKPVRQEDPASLRALRRNMQFVFQDPFASLNPRMRVGDCVKEPMLIHNLYSGAQADRRAAELFERVGLDAAMMQRWPHEFSGGQRQRICIARALSVDPKVLIADESVSALDVSIQAQIVNLLIDLQRDLGVSYLFISHDMAVVERISHRVAVMYLGQIVEIGPRQAIFENPQHPYTKKLMQAVPIADPGARRSITLELSELPSPARPVGDEPVVKPLEQAGPGHFVARHRIGGAY
ncbi:dipeptide ABC transporter ATP-binding protein [Bordetella bronchiseptica]|uniref:Glutathione import ATP-binding protein GsiA n=2 Tax=Bordetella bronchiseptica TaxID=518 RepID=A0A0C6P4J8_BORBO|nr:dipeptide ABC transporter ATP-binding protein [Bordetella bronchiseptica]SHR09784.1 Putative oligopeptide ABC transporter, ATP-binding protein [Mycobacteroides abscessus subsp. abscessus]AWP73773.1 ABC transporter ATP-binding protein [Bordetella bronchiseptica]AZW11323.1 ABC transporter ATP-binding protein [Bordetella bronchiseptica]AZW20587.1 ABC transporter ATP-binding protein [Bordetella bronchiseptica]KCV35540.1 glutathione ABC transporter, ATP-binding protein GsiA [Bordetella bronchise